MHLTRLTPETAATNQCEASFLIARHDSAKLKLDPAAIYCDNVQFSIKSFLDWSDFPILYQYKSEDEQPSDNKENEVVVPQSSLAGAAKKKRTRSERQKKKKVSFSPVQELRAYEVILGDHPCCHSLPLSLGWHHKKTELVAIDDEDDERSIHKAPSRHDFRLDYCERVLLLQNATGLTEEQLINKQHERILNNLKTSSSKSRGRLKHGWPTATSLSAYV